MNSARETGDIKRGFPGGSAGKESACDAGDLGSIPGLRRFLGVREQLPTPIFLPREFHGLYSPWGHNELDKTKQLSLLFFLISRKQANLKG